MNFIRQGFRKIRSDRQRDVPRPKLYTIPVCGWLGMSSELF